MTTLGSVCSEFVDCEHKTAPIDVSGEYFAVGTPAMKGNVIDYAEARRISEETYRVWTRRLRPRAGDILFAREAPVGPVVRIPEAENVAPGQRTVLMRIDPNLADPAFVYFLLTGPDAQTRIHEKSAGSTVPHLNVPDIKAFDLGELPPVKEQRAIAEVLGALDDKIAANQVLRTKSAVLSTALYFAAIGSDASTMTVTEGAALLTRGASPKYTDDEQGTLVLNQKCVRDGDIDLQPARRTEPDRVRKGTLLMADDVLVNSTGTGTVGRVARWTRPDVATVDSHVTLVRPAPEVVDPAVFGVALVQLQAEIEGLAEGSTGQTELSRQQLGGLAVVMPSREAQAVLGAKLRALAASSLAAHIESERLTSLRETLLPEFMSGRMRVKDAEAEVEGVL